LGAGGAEAEVGFLEAGVGFSEEGVGFLEADVDFLASGVGRGAWVCFWGLLLAVFWRGMA